MLITIGITCFNAKDTIEKAVRSALAQDWPEKEIVIVDDASADGSREVIKRLAAEHPQVRLVFHPVNRGYAGAVNSIVREARGEFVAIFDDDDESVPERLALQVSRIQAYEAAHRSNLVLCYSNRNVIKAGFDTPDHVAEAIGRRAPEPSGPAVADFLFGLSKDNVHVWGIFGSCTLMARRRAFLSVGEFDETFRRCAEWDFAVRAAFMDAHFIAVDRPLVTQWKTPSADKAGRIPLTFSLQLRSKYKRYLTRKRAYHASRALAYAQYFGSKRRSVRSRLHLAAAMLLAPTLFASKLRQRAARALDGRLSTGHPG
jgi:glycosyltransferase involved in cell wall biosynthesis